MSSCVSEDFIPAVLPVSCWPWLNAVSPGESCMMDLPALTSHLPCFFRVGGCQLPLGLPAEQAGLLLHVALFWHSLGAICVRPVEEGWLGKKGMQSAFLWDSSCLWRGVYSLSVLWDKLSWLECGANNDKVVGLVPVWAIHLTVGINDPFVSFPIQNILSFCSDYLCPFQLKIFCHSVVIIPLRGKKKNLCSWSSLKFPQEGMGEQREEG